MMPAMNPVPLAPSRIPAIMLYNDEIACTGVGIVFTPLKKECPSYKNERSLGEETLRAI
jgi:hypothetical protein